ncbi:MAG: hypothetical protein ABIN45_02505 [Gammaproteobacteria bacterium]
MTNADVVDGQAARIPGFPYLRADRFLASFHGESLTAQAFAAWLIRLQALAETGYRVELNNLGETERVVLRRLIPADMNSPDLNAAIHECSDRLRSSDMNDTEQREMLRSVARVPAEYRGWQRVVGLYPLTAMAFAWGIDRWHEEVREVFARDVAALPVDGRIIRYMPAVASPPLNAHEVAAILERARQNPLRIPEPNAAELQRLFENFAPIFEVDTVSEDDRLGAPMWRNEQIPLVDTTQPTVYTHSSYTRYGDDVLLQLNYVVWFPARPRSGALDLLAGHLDGITWRVTLTHDGHPWVYDIIHNCGCYHLFIPTRRAVLRDQPVSLEETAFVPQPAPSFQAGAHLTLHIARGTHYLQRVLSQPSAVEQIIAYQWAGYDDLRSLPTSQGGMRSLFRSDGIVPGSDRGERYFFWPMGIPHPGAMRQWGHHATAFVGRRHFDDPDLLERYFELVP